jgi:hypothetical protein
MKPGTDRAENRQCMPRPDLLPLTQNERFWLETIRLASWDTDPAPTLERVQQLRQIFDPTRRGGRR